MRIDLMHLVLECEAVDPNYLEEYEELVNGLTYMMH
jgi:hypothetical protein